MDKSAKSSIVNSELIGQSKYVLLSYTGNNTDSFGSLDVKLICAV